MKISYPLVLAAALVTSMAMGQTTETVTYSYNGNAVPIFADEADIISIATIYVPKALKISKVTAKVQIAFDGVGDLNVFLYSPALTRTKLLERNCGSLRNVDTSFDDAAAEKFSDFCPAEAGRGPYRGNEPLSNFNDQIALGTFRLAVENSGSNKVGWLTGFSVTITGTLGSKPTFVRETIVSSASLRATGTVAPGERISIFGSGLGPSDPVTAPAGNLPTTLGGTTVLVDNVAVPIAYASNFRVDVQLPYVWAPAGVTHFQVNRDGFTTDPVEVDVAYTRPAVYTSQPLGIGQLKAINPDGTLNGPDHPAPKGGTISLYASGLGSVSPEVLAGVVAPSSPLSYAVYPVGAAIAGVPCTVQFAGLAPGLVGIFQVNVVVNPAISSGAKEFLLNSYGSTSQDGVLVYIQ